MVLMSLIAGRERRCIHREWTSEHTWGTERVGQIGKVALTGIHYHVESI